MRQIIQIFDEKRNGFISRQLLSDKLRSLCESFTLDQSRLICTYFDERGTGKINVTEFCSVLQELLNQQIGGGIFAFMQVKPII